MRTDADDAVRSVNYHVNAAETGEYLYDPNYRDIEQVVHTLSAMFKPTSVEPELRQGL